jgi:diaminopimelate epimerase
MCGNGIRCVGKYVAEHGLSANNPLRVETDSGIKILDLFWVLPAYENVSDARSNPETVTRAEANELTASFQAARWTTIGVLGAGVAVAGSSFFVHPAGVGLAIDGVW